MAHASDYTEAGIGNLLFQGTAFSVGSTRYISLHTADPTDAGTGTEVSGGSYARVQRDASAANWPKVGSVWSNAADIAFASPTANWGVITWAAMWDAATGGNMIARAPLAVAKTVNNGDAPFKLLAGDLTFEVL